MKRSTRWMCALAVSAAFATAGSAVRAEDGVQMIMKDIETAAADGLQWTEPKGIPAGAKMLSVYGSPDKPGPYVFRVKFPAGYKLPPHRHPDQRHVTVLSGSYWTAAGETFAQDKLTKFKQRDYYITEANVPHFAWAETDVVIQESGFGPIGESIEYVSKGDDPRK